MLLPWQMIARNMPQLYRVLAFFSVLTAVPSSRLACRLESLASDQLPMAFTPVGLHRTFCSNAPPHASVCPPISRSQAPRELSLLYPSYLSSISPCLHPLMARRMEPGESPWNADDRTIGQWLELSDGQLCKIRAGLPSTQRGEVLDKRLGITADGEATSIVPAPGKANLMGWMELSGLEDRFPRVTCDSKSRVEGFLRVDFRMSKADARSIVMRSPRLLVIPREEAVERCDWMAQKLALSKKHIAKMVFRCPALFLYGVDTCYVPVVEWLQRYLGLSTKQAARIVTSLPQVLGLSPEVKLEGTAKFFESLGLDRVEVAELLLKHPKLFSYSVEQKVVPTLDWLQSRLRASRDEVICMVSRYPSLLGCSIERNLAPKLTFLQAALGGSTDDIRRAVVASPSLLGYSLDRRIRPRVSSMIDRDILPRFVQHKWTLTVMDDESFEEWLDENST